MNNNIFIDTLQKTIKYSKYADGFRLVGTSGIIAFENGNRAKLTCGNKEIYVSIINKIDGIVDKNTFPFANYFSAKRCSAGAPPWYPFIDGIRWYFSQYPHCVPNTADYIELASGIDDYISLFE
ncbi:MAG: hypothetical protein IKG47_00505 [Oscillospiraceae bacterium]|nr:hypothetical protein [Clostridiales bacterium]MBR3353826.1 hypothetical protein [Oscillospiraceae bacterium]